MKKTILAIGVLLSFCMSGLAQAAVQTYQPTPSDLYGLDHYKYYTWGIDLGVNTNDVTITAASITFSNIYDWTIEDYHLYVQLLDSAPIGVTIGTDNQDPSNAFAGNGQQLTDYRPGPGSIPEYWYRSGTWPHFTKHYTTGSDDITQLGDITYNFTDTDLSWLNTYAEDGVIGLGFDPDCHFFNDGVTFNITTASSGNANTVPEPATMLLFGTGLIGLAGVRMRRKKN